MRTIMKEQVKSAKTVQLPAALVWQKLVAFGGTEKFVPELIEKVTVAGSGPGALRTVYLKGGREILEKLTRLDEQNRQLHFVILSTPMPVQNYEGILAVSATGEGECLVSFASVYDVDAAHQDDMRAIIKGFQETFLSNLHRE